MAGGRAREFGKAAHCKPGANRHQLASLASVLVALAMAGLGSRAAASETRAAPSASAAADGGIVFKPCRLEDSTHLLAVEAECGRLAVPENPAAPRGRQIELFVARVRAVSLRERSDPLFVLAGGPGQAASAFYPEAAAALATIHRDRDIILVDQRGTGRSNGLYCHFKEETSGESADELVGAARQCLQALGTHADVALYTTTLAVGDLDRVRAALGYRRIDLYGVSYGTRVAQEYMRRFPRRVRAAILDGVVPPQIALGARLPLNAQAALDRIFSRCSREPACHDRFGDPAAAWRSLAASLAKRPVTVSLESPSTGEPMTLPFTAEHLATVLRLSSYTSEQAALLPLLLHQASARGDFVPLAAQYLIVSRTYADAVADGMQNTVVCTEDVPLYSRAGIDPERLEHTFLGMRQIDALEQICAVWPRGPIDPNFHAPLRSDVPVLLLSGADDPVTPPAYAAEAARGLTHHLILDLPGMGHGQLTAPCVGRLMAQFIERGSTAGLDVSCVRRVRAFPFFTSFAGPSP
jgi:pimeloyl-ACP methyl ester carboxylesterase